jgi:hypothetical protein
MKELDDTRLLKLCNIVIVKRLSESSESFNEMYEKIQPELIKVFKDLSYASQPEVICRAIIKLLEANHYAVLFDRNEFLDITEIKSLGNWLNIFTKAFTEQMIHSSL